MGAPQGNGAEEPIDIELHEPGPYSPRYRADAAQLGLHVESETLVGAIMLLVRGMREPQRPDDRAERQ